MVDPKIQRDWVASLNIVQHLHVFKTAEAIYFTIKRTLIGSVADRIERATEIVLEFYSIDDTEAAERFRVLVSGHLDSHARMLGDDGDRLGSYERNASTTVGGEGM